MNKSKFLKIILHFIYSLLFRLHGLAVFLDPRFKHQSVDNKEQFCNNVEIWISEELSDNALIFDAEPASKKLRKESSAENSIFDLHSSLIKNQEISTLTENTAVTHELLKYKAEPCTPLSLNPVDYWKVSNLVINYR